MENQNLASVVFTIEGAIQELHIPPSVVNLIEDLQRGMLFTGMVAGLTDGPGMLANAGSLCLYESEDVEHIALLINDKFVIGTFEWVQDLKIGDEIKLVVSEIDNGILFVHAVLRKKDEVLWTPYSVDHTRRGLVMQGIKLAAAMIVFLWLLYGSFYLIGGQVIEDRQEFFMFISTPIVFVTFVVCMCLRGMMHLGDEAEDIFRALGIPKYRRFRINSFGIPNSDFSKTLNSRKKKYIFYFADALTAHKNKFNLP